MFALLVVCAPARADWSTLVTDDLVIYYPRLPGLPSQHALALRVLAELEAGRARIERLTTGEIRRLPVVLQDVGQYTNGIADPVFHSIQLYPYEPGSGSGLGYVESWLRELSLHELTHIGHLTAARGFPRVLASIFGPALGAGLLTTAWMTEGLSVYVESSSSAHEGRLKDSLFDAFVGLQAREGRLPNLARATYSTETYPFGNAAYLYGASFVRYLVSLGGEERMTSFLRGHAESALSYLSPLLPAVGLDRMARRTWGKSLKELWDDWREAAAGSAQPEVAERYVSGAGASSISSLVPYDGWLYYARSERAKTGRGERSVSRIVRVRPEGGEEHVILTTPSSFTTPFAIRDGTLYYSVDELEPGHGNVVQGGWGLTSILRARPLSGGPDRRLLRAALRAFVPLEGGSILYAVDASTLEGSELWVREPDSEPRLLRRLPIRILELVTDGRTLLLGARPPGANEDIFSLDLSRIEDADLEAVVESPWAERTLSLSGGTLLYAANAMGGTQVLAYDLLAREIWRYPVGAYGLWPVLDASRAELFYAGLASDGPRVVGVPADRRAAEGGSPPDTGLTASPPAPEPVGYIESGWAPNLSTLVPRVRSPLLSIDRGSVQAGLWLWGKSAIGDIEYSVRGLYDFGTQLPVVEASLNLRLMAPIDLSLDYYSAAGHTLAGTVSLTPWRSQQTGVFGVRLDLVTAARETFQSVDFTPGLFVGLRGPWIEATVYLAVPLEASAFGSPRDRVGLRGLVLTTAALLGGELEVGLQGAWDPRSLSPVLPVVRGHDESLVGRTGARATVEYEHALLRIRNGFWNPALYFGDLLVGVFGEAALTQAELEAAVGASMTLELRALAVSTGVAVYLEGWVGADEAGRFIWGFDVRADPGVDILQRGRWRP